jgi:hypothetical protein
MFCAAAQPDYKKATESRAGVKSYAIVDNFTTVAPLSYLKKPHQEVKAAEKGGSRLNLGKCAVHFFGSESEAKAHRAWIEGEGVKPRSTWAASWAGTARRWRSWP